MTHSDERHLDREPSLRTIEAARDAIDFADHELQLITPSLHSLMALRERLFKVEDPVLEKIPGEALSSTYQRMKEKLSADPTENNLAIKSVLGLRKNSTLEFHNETEKYNDSPDDTASRARKKFTYRQEILYIAQELGFVAQAPGKASNPLDRELGIPDSTSEKITGPVEAIIVASARGKTPRKRLRDGIRDIELGKVQTNRIIFTTGERPTDDAEKQTAEKEGYAVGNTEYEAAILAAQDLLGIEFPEEEHTFTVPYGDNLQGHYRSAQAVIDGKLIEIQVVHSPLDPNRKMADGSPAKRGSSEETFLAAGALLGDGPGRIVVKSHDTWVHTQRSRAIEIFGLEFGKKVTVNGPFNDDRVIWRKMFNETVMDINSAEGVVDEIAKYQDALVELRVAALKKLEEAGELDASNERELNMLEALLAPVTRLEEYRNRKAEYRTLPIDEVHEKYNEKLVDISQYGIAGQSYYSRPNAGSIDPVPEVPKTVLVRQSIAEELAGINEFLKDPLITQFFGGEVELYVEEGLRIDDVQHKLHHEWMPKLVRQQHPDWTDEQVRQRASELAAKPDPEMKSPTPHMTGGAVDVILRYKQPTLDWVEGAEVPMGHFDGNTIGVDPDYFEYHFPTTPEERVARRNRRAFFAIMTGSAFGIKTNFAFNPTELWHISRGDQLAALVSGRPAYYSFAPKKEMMA